MRLLKRPANVVLTFGRNTKNKSLFLFFSGVGRHGAKNAIPKNTANAKGSVWVAIMMHIVMSPQCSKVFRGLEFVHGPMGEGIQKISIH